jgi:hypothetical protein
MAPSIWIEMTVEIPNSVAECLQEEMLAALDLALGPPPPARPQVAFDVELEDADEETFVLHYANGETTAEEGFAEDDPFISVRISGDIFETLRPFLQAAVERFPDAPLMAEGQDRLDSLTRKDFEEVHGGLARLSGFKIVLKVGQGSVSLARGAMDEATRKVEIRLDEGALGELIQGQDPREMSQSAATSGELGILTQILTALGPAALALRR